MRMNPATGQSAEQWINSAGEAEIADVLYQYGEERHSRRMARRVILERTEKLDFVQVTGVITTARCWSTMAKL